METAREMEMGREREIGGRRRYWGNGDKRCGNVQKKERQVFTCQNICAMMHPASIGNAVQICSVYSFILKIKLYDLKTEVNQNKVKLTRIPSGESIWGSRSKKDRLLKNQWR
jgi:hypothetical protein